MNCQIYDFQKEKAARLGKRIAQTSRQLSGAREEMRQGSQAPHQIGEIAKGIIERLERLK